MSKLLSPAGIGDVVSPFAVTWSVELQEWFSQGDSASRILPTIWTHMCTVANVSAQASGGGSSGHGVLASFIGLFLPSTVWSSACRASALRAGGSQHRLHGHGPPPARYPAFPLFEPSSGGSPGRNRQAITPMPTASMKREEGRRGKAWASTGRCRGTPTDYKKK